MHTSTLKVHNANKMSIQHVIHNISIEVY